MWSCRPSEPTRTPADVRYPREAWRAIEALAETGRVALIGVSNVTARQIRELDDGRWVHDGEKFVDGTYRITCASCAHVVFAHDACPRCHAAGGLLRALGDPTRLTVPKRCPACNGTELVALALIAATARTGGGKAPSPRPLGELGDPGYHIVAYACESCEAAVVAQTCPLCDGPGPLRPRP